MDWDIEADVVVVGFGAAGACAALEAAAAGRSVVVLDRFDRRRGHRAVRRRRVRRRRHAAAARGGRHRHARRRCSATCAPRSATWCRPRRSAQFCDGSVAMLGWLEGHGVPFEGSLCPDKTSYPTNRHYLYYSGSEVSAARRRARPRRAATGPGAAAPPAGCCSPGWPPPPGGRASRWWRRPRAVRLITDRRPGDRRGVPLAARRAVVGARGAPRAAPRGPQALPVRAEGSAGSCTGRSAGWSAGTLGPCWSGRPRGVVIAAGGFGANRRLLRAHAPSARGGLPLATPGDDGSGMLLGTAAGGATALLDRVSVWRFLSPPPALLRGVLVDADGQADLRRVPVRRGDRRRDRPPRRAGLAVRGPGHDRRGPAAAARLDPVVPAAAGVVPADPRAGTRGHGGRGRGQGRRRPRRPGGDVAAYNAVAARPGGSPPTRRASRPIWSPPAGPAAVLADRLLDPAPAAQPGPGADPRRPGGRPRDRPGAAP